jgi:HlyD family secretion protein
MAKDLVIQRATQAAIAASESEAASERALLEFQSPTAALIALPVPFTARLTTWLVTSFVFFGILALCLIKVDRVVTATGQVVSLSPDIVVQPLEVSIVRGVYVKEGQVVHAGDLLAQLDPTFTGDDAKSTGAQADSLQAEVDRLTAELEGRPYVSDGTIYSQLQAALYAQRQMQFQSGMENHQQKIDSLQAKVEQAEKDIASFGARLKDAQQVENMRSELERLQVGSKLNTLAARDARRQLEGQLGDAESTLKGGQRDLAAMVAERDNYAHQWRADASQQLATQGRLLADMRGQAGKNQLRHQLVDLRAPQDAVVLSIAKVSVGTVMQSGAEFIKMVPVDAPLEVEGFVPGDEAGFVHVGDNVAIKFNTLPYFQYGYALGMVRTVSADSFADPREGRGDTASLVQPANVTPDHGPVGVLFYRAQISIDEMKLRNVPSGFRLTPGMPLSADIKVGKRTMMGFLLARLVPGITEGMREP